MLGSISEFIDFRELRGHVLAIIAYVLHSTLPLNAHIMHDFVRFAAFPMEPDTLDNLERIYHVRPLSSPCSSSWLLYDCFFYLCRASRNVASRPRRRC